MSKTVVEVKQLTKVYKDHEAVKNISFSLEENKIYGMLGRNGAGKTTIMHMLTSQLFPTSGDIEVFGEEPYENYSVLNRICFIKESQKYPQNFRVADVLEIASKVYPMWDEAFASRLVKAFDLPLKRHVKKLSRGMLSAVGIIVGLASRAPLTVFDEPYLGLDAVSRQLFYDQLLADYSEHPRTVILSTHLIDEINELLEHVFIINKGELMINEDVETLRGRALTISGHKDQVAKFTAGKKVIAEVPFGVFQSSTILVESGKNDKAEATEMGLEVTPVSLQQLFVHLTGVPIEQTEVQS
ncbi:ABC transporter ATP-binding protein [Aureibacillus halotolerans]|uniref:ABC-2 type transport system ATP-binding protein n=1 Tax=Aureibacillus halotolerans TaxID=1508390 RepID=A0A4R6U8E6_9BACI|nr:ABC transporter ATP-binding protein [Aureibacillus halotolerans]TDQ42850.1 ABC-2 type transport system ATP-binding protein [Aureibacillus halotolerans]